MHLCLTLATLCHANQTQPLPLAPQPDDVLEPAVTQLRQLLHDFLNQPVSPDATFQLEQQLQQLVHEQARLALQWVLNQVEPANPDDLPKHVRFQGECYTRLNHTTPTEVSTTFGTIRLQRIGYRSTDKSSEPTLFPLARCLGLVQGTTPALAERLAYYQAQAGATQRQTLQRLRDEHQVNWGVKKLRQVTATLSEALDEQRQEVQVERLLQLLSEASASSGRHKPVLSVGRDGVSLGLQVPGGDSWEMASTGTVSVLDRRGRRLGTVYLAYTPQSLQTTLSEQLTQLLSEVLQRWQGPLPRLCYVTDAGDNETSYYEQVLRRLRHPRTGERLTWIRVLDYYHVSERIWTMAEALFGSGGGSWAWARRMQKWLKERGGAKRVLRSAAALCHQRSLGEKRAAAYRLAYNYIRDRLGYVRYAEYRRLGLPLGSGVTEAACKTVYGARLKLSGMRWHKAGAQTILNLRVLLLSGVWTESYTRVLQRVTKDEVLTYGTLDQNEAKKAA
jgi:hypothetical protein